MTATACHYPQAIVFRFTMAISASFLSLIYFVIFRWLTNLKKKIHYPGHIPSWLHPLGQISVLGYLIAIGTIDADGTSHTLHGPGAVFFFIVLFLLTTTVTCIIRDMRHWDTSIISRSSMRIKTALSYYVIAVGIFFIVGELFFPS